MLRLALLQRSLPACRDRHCLGVQAVCTSAMQTASQAPPSQRPPAVSYSQKMLLLVAPWTPAHRDSQQSAAHGMCCCLSLPGGQLTETTSSQLSPGNVVACRSLDASSDAIPQLVLTHTPRALQVLVYGRGLDVITTARVQALGEVWCNTHVVQRPELMSGTGQGAAGPKAQPPLLRRRQHPAKYSNAAANLGSHHLVAVATLVLHRLLLRPSQLLRHAQPMVLEVLVPGAVVRRLQLQQPEADATGLTVHLQSDFLHASLPVVFRQLQQQLSPTAVGLNHS